MPVASSSVSEARKTASTEPTCSTSLRALVGPRPWVREIASHSTRCVADGDAVIVDKIVLSADCSQPRRGVSRSHVTNFELNLWKVPNKNETSTHFRHFLP